jgi:DNA modification methylase
MSEPTSPYRHDPFFQNYFGEHPAKEVLKADIRQTGRVLKALVVWDEDAVLIDGYTREQLHAELTAEGVQLPPLEVVRLSFPSREDAEKYILTHQGAMRQVDKNKRAWTWIVNHAAELDAMRLQARRNQSCAGGRQSQNGDESVPAHAPEAPSEPETAAPAVDVRRYIKEAIGGDTKDTRVSEKIVGAALKLHDWLKRTDHPKYAEIVAVQRAFERQEFTYRDVDDYITKLIDEERANRTRDKAIADTPEPARAADHPTGTVAPNGIFCRDSIDGVKGIAPNTVSLFFTSPPYPLGDYEYNGREFYDGKYGEYLAWLKENFAAAYKAARTGGRYAVQIDAVDAKHKATGKSMTLPLYPDVVRIMAEVGWQFWYEVCWYKQCCSGRKGRIRWGSKFSPRAPFIRRVHEYILVFFKETPVLTGDKRNETIRHAEFKDLTLSQWYCPPETTKFISKSGVKHPCPFPLTIPYNAIQLWTYAGDVVCDPFNGSGSTTLAAHCMGRQYIGIDSEAEFCAIAQGRIDDLSALTPAERLKWIRDKRFTPRIFDEGMKEPKDGKERKDGWGLSKHDGNNFSRRFRNRKPPKLDEQ